MSEEAKASALTVFETSGENLPAISEPGMQLIMNKLEAMHRSMERQLAAQNTVLLAQAEELSRLNIALNTVRISRTQELAILEAIRSRSRELERAEGLPAGSAKRISAAIRTTIREVYGARAAGDIQAGQYDKAMELVLTWRMAGALRRIRRSMEART